jgi:RNA polymerase subunit RPABC4/transcription elongation factor Spt4
MPACRNCGTDLGASDNFCPNCATPQNDEASRRLDAYIDKRAAEMAGGGARGGLRGRLQYAIGHFAIVVGLATLSAGAGIFFVLAGLFVLPPVQNALETRLGRSIGTRPTAAAAGVLSVVGAASFVLV